MTKWIKLPEQGTWVNLAVMATLIEEARGGGQRWGKLMTIFGSFVLLSPVDYEFVQQRLQELQFDYVDQYC